MSRKKRKVSTCSGSWFQPGCLVQCLNWHWFAVVCFAPFVYSFSARVWKEVIMCWNSERWQPGHATYKLSVQKIKWKKTRENNFTRQKFKNRKGTTEKYSSVAFIRIASSEVLMVTVVECRRIFFFNFHQSEIGVHHRKEHTNIY